MNHSIPNPFFLKIIFSRVIRICANNAQMERNIPTGYTPLNLVSSLSGCKLLIAKMLSVAFPITLSPRVRKIPSMINALHIPEKKISAQIFLFSVLLILLKKYPRDKRAATINPT